MRKLHFVLSMALSFVSLRSASAHELSQAQAPQLPPRVVLNFDRPAEATATPFLSGKDREICPTGHLFGTDVSNFTVGTNWTKAEAGGVKFAIIKATEGSWYVNPYFAGDWANAKKNGLIRGAYHIFHPSMDPTKSAEFFLQTIGTLGPMDLPPVLDMELTDNMQSSAIVSNALIWLKVVQAATGKTPMIYLSPNFSNAYLDDAPALGKYPLWVADPNPVPCPRIPPEWNSWAIWQYAIGPVPGVRGNRGDLDSFNGSESDLLNFAASGQ